MAKLLVKCFCVTGRIHADASVRQQKHEDAIYRFDADSLSIACWLQASKHDWKQLHILGPAHFAVVLGALYTQVHRTIRTHDVRHRRAGALVVLSESAGAVVVCERAVA